ncbi:ABC transporter substrate-binding protein [Allomesorhizobium camelthorni]|uniref:ABC transporter substrate-binding protein n=1 Tax=Allomesorhizobium camelthorni TaxID=475069 RepID=A0A6G4WGW3_9HYPH|nr:ABC transporter substrate-binding protein [Mesorhizobium camelthorni]NGO53337.1 ABC transporter substrate-binding protein [Mesorhizobium camelthorni]
MRVACRFRSLLAPMLGVLLAATLPAEANEGVAVFSDPSPIASIVGAITEIVYAPGEESHLVARDSTSQPKAALKLPDVGYMRQPSPEGVLLVKPSGVLVLHGSGAAKAADVLKKSNGPFIEAPEHYSHEDILEKIRVVGKALGVEAKAEKSAAEMDAKLKAAEKQTSSIKERKRILFVLSTKGGKILAPDTSTARDGIMLQLCQRPRGGDQQPSRLCPLPAPAVWCTGSASPAEPGRLSLHTDAAGSVVRDNV